MEFDPFHPIESLRRKRNVNAVIGYLDASIETYETMIARQKIVDDFYAARGRSFDEVPLAEHMANLKEMMSTPEWQDPSSGHQT